MLKLQRGARDLKRALTEEAEAEEKTPVPMPIECMLHSGHLRATTKNSISKELTRLFAPPCPLDIINLPHGNMFIRTLAIDTVVIIGKSSVA
jgi:hypothetical protein